MLRFQFLQCISRFLQKAVWIQHFWSHYQLEFLRFSINEFYISLRPTCCFSSVQLFNKLGLQILLENAESAGNRCMWSIKGAVCTKTYCSTEQLFYSRRYLPTNEAKSTHRVLTFSGFFQDSQALIFPARLRSDLLLKPSDIIRQTCSCDAESSIRFRGRGSVW